MSAFVAAEKPLTAQDTEEQSVARFRLLAALDKLPTCRGWAGHVRTLSRDTLAREVLPVLRARLASGWPPPLPDRVTQTLDALDAFVVAIGGAR